jgi:hypothetical protein
VFDVVFLIFEQVRGVVVDGDGSDFIADPVEFASTFAGVVFAGDFSHDIQTVSDLSEDRVAVVEERNWEPLVPGPAFAMEKTPGAA